MKSKCLLILSLALVMGPGKAGSVVSAAGAAEDSAEVRLTPDYIAGLSEVMRTNHPGLRALAARSRAAGHVIEGVRTWEDPMFKLGGVVATDRGPRLEEEGDLVYEVEQKLPLFGKAAAERRMASRESEVAQARDEMQFQLYRRDLARLLFAAAAAESTLAVGRRDLAWLETMTAAADERNRAGGGALTELLRLRNERSRRLDMIKTDTLMRDHVWVSINRLLNRPQLTPLPRLLLPEPWPEVRFDSRLIDYAIKFEPNVRLMAREIEAAEARVAVTRKARLPEVIAGIEGRQWSRDGNFREGVFTVGLSLPWLNRSRYRHDEARDRARLEAAQFDRANEIQRVEEEIHGVFVEIDSARREALLYRDEILPRSRQALDLAHANWIAGRAMLMETMEARRMLLEAELMMARAVARQYSALNELVLCCGLGDLGSLEMLLEKVNP